MNSTQGLRGFITFLILLAILSTGMLGFNYITIPTNNSSEADSPKTEPLNISVNNITESAAEITWSTVDAATGTVVYSKDIGAPCLSSTSMKHNDDCMYYDLIDSSNSHSAKLNNLSPETAYFFRILVNSNIYPKNENKNFRTASAAVTPSEKRTNNDDSEGFGQADPDTPKVVNQVPKKVLGVSDDKSIGKHPQGKINRIAPDPTKPTPEALPDKIDENTQEPGDPLGNIDSMMQEEFKEAMTYQDLRYDFNKDKQVTLADYPLFIAFATSYED